MTVSEIGSGENASFSAADLSFNELNLGWVRACETEPYICKIDFGKTAGREEDVHEGYGNNINRVVLVKTVNLWTIKVRSLFNT